jgi:hypothetical protein
VARDAHALIAGVHPIEQDLSLVPAPAVDLEHAVERGLEPWKSLFWTLIAGTSCVSAEYCRDVGMLGDRLAADYLLGACARHIDDRRLAADRNRVGDAADFQSW